MLSFGTLRGGTPVLLGPLPEKKVLQRTAGRAQGLWRAGKHGWWGGGVRAFDKGQDGLCVLLPCVVGYRVLPFATLRKEWAARHCCVGWDEASFHGGIFHCMHAEHE